MVLAFSGVVGLWGIGFFSFDLIRAVFVEHFRAQGLSPQEVAGKLTFWSGITSLVQNAGAFLGIYAFAVTHHIGRKPAFAISFVLAAIATAATFWFLDSFWQIFVLSSIMRFLPLAAQAAMPPSRPYELFPTRLSGVPARIVLLQRRPARCRGRSADPVDLLTSKVFAGYPGRTLAAGRGGSRCARYFSWACSLSPSHPRPRDSRCPNDLTATLTCSRAFCPQGAGVRRFHLAREGIWLRRVCSSNLIPPGHDSSPDSGIRRTPSKTPRGCRQNGIFGQPDQEGFLQHATCDRLDRGIEPVDLHSLLYDIVPPDGQSVVGKDLVVCRDVPFVLNRVKIDLIDSSRFARHAVGTRGGYPSSAELINPPANCRASSTVSFPVQGSLPATWTSPRT